MGILEKLFPAKTVITSGSIRDEIRHAEEEIAAHRVTLSAATASIATMSDAEHIAAESDLAATRRAVARLEARVAHLNDELPKAIAAEEAAAIAAADEALRQRANAAHKANTKEAAKLLADYDAHAAKIGDILARLEQIADETSSVNAALQKNPVAESVAYFGEHHRKGPDRQASERREMRPVWVYSDGTTAPATMNSSGKINPADRVWDYNRQTVAQPRLEQREVVVERTAFRPGQREVPLSVVVLPPGFAGGPGHWPRRR